MIPSHLVAGRGLHCILQFHGPVVVPQKLLLHIGFEVQHYQNKSDKMLYNFLTSMDFFGIHLDETKQHNLDDNFHNYRNHILVGYNIHMQLGNCKPSMLHLKNIDLEHPKVDNKYFH